MISQKPIWRVSTPVEEEETSSETVWAPKPVRTIFILADRWYDVREQGRMYFGLPEVDTEKYTEGLEKLLATTFTAVFEFNITGSAYNNTLEKSLVLLKAAFVRREPLIVQTPTALMMVEAQVKKEKENAKKIPRRKR